MTISGAFSSATPAYTIDTGASTLATTAADPVDTDLTSASLALASTALLVMGELPVTLDTLYDQSPALTGATAGGAAVSAAFSDGGMPRNGTAGEAGDFSLDLGDYLPATGSTATVQAYSDNLRARQRAVVQDGSAFALAFLEVPPILDFGQVAIASQPQWVAPAAQVFNIRVEDSRLRRGDWHLQVELGSDLATTDAGGDTLAGALVTKAGDGTPNPLDGTARTVHTQAGSYPDTVTVDMAGQLWLYLPANAGLRDAAYSGEVHWSLVSAP